MLMVTAVTSVVSKPTAVPLMMLVAGPVLDASAISLARENRIPILVFSLFESGGFAEVLAGRGRYTIIREPD